jgi:hypothetical protein
LNSYVPLGHEKARTTVLSTSDRMAGESCSRERIFRETRFEAISIESGEVPVSFDTVPAGRAPELLRCASSVS